MPKVKVIYDSLFAGVTQRREELFSADGETLLGLLLSLGESYGDRFRRALFTGEGVVVRPEIAVLLNGQRAEPESKLREGDVVVLLVPFAGG